MMNENYKLNNSRLQQIDTRQGTNNRYEFGHGNTLPYTGTPFGMNHFVLMSRWDDVRFYHPEDVSLFGIRLTHQPSPWMGDFCFSIMHGQLVTDEEIEAFEVLDQGQLDANQFQAMFRTNYMAQEAIFQPHYLSYRQLKDHLSVELIASERGASLRYSSSELAYYQLQRTQHKELSFVYMIMLAGDVQVEVAGSKRLNVCTDFTSGSKYNQLGQYQSIYFQDEIELISSFQTELLDESIQVLMVKVDHPINQHSSIELDVSTSYISWEQAEINYRCDAFYQLEWDGKVHHSAELWNDYLNRIDVEDSDGEKMKTFYTCLYRTATFPQMAYELDEQGEIIHYSPYTSEVESGIFYTNNGYWDTFRTNYPLYALIIPEKVPAFIEGILNVYKEDHYLPKWLSPDERGLMPGTLVDGVIADAVVKGLVSEEMAEALLEAMIYTANNEGGHETEGRQGYADYLDPGYLPNTYHESVNKSLDYCFSDFCIGQVASYLGKDELAQEYWERSLNYRHLFDRQFGSMHPKDSKGRFTDDFVLHRWGEGFTEGSAWQNSLSVFHNIQDLIDLYGGDEAFYHHLYDLVNQLPIYEHGSYHQEIHEMTELAQANFGQLALSNQPSFHIPYLFIYAGYPHVTHLLVQLLLKTFNSSVDGFLGDEDNGSLSSWYVLSSLGLYAVTPGTTEYVLGMNDWQKSRINLENGSTIKWSTPYHTQEATHVKERFINGNKYIKEYINYGTLMKGVSIVQDVGIVPPIEKVLEKHRPFSLKHHME